MNNEPHSHRALLSGAACTPRTIVGEDAAAIGILYLPLEIISRQHPGCMLPPAQPGASA